MFELVRCCRCDEPVRLPESNTAVWVRCPHCGDDYPLDQIRSQLPPALVVIPQPSLVAVSADHEESSPTGGTTSGTELTTSQPARARVLIDDDRYSVHVRSPKALAADRKKPTTSRTPKSSPLKVVLGGVAGLLLGQLVLWWLPQPYRTDPLELGPRIPSALGFLAPASIRGEVRQPFFVPRESNPVPDPKGNSDGAASADPLDVSDTEQPVPVAPTRPTNASEVMLGLADAPRVRMMELKNSLKAATTADQALSGNSAWNDDSVGQWYKQLSELAYCVTFADMSEPDINQFAKETKVFLSAIAVDGRRAAAIGNIAVETIDNATLHRKGIVVAGTAKRIAAVGRLFQTEVLLTGDSGKRVNILSRVDPREKVYAAGDKVMIVGVVITAPSRYLMGYQGSAEAVVLGGLPLKIN